MATVINGTTGIDKVQAGAIQADDFNNALSGIFTPIVIAVTNLDSVTTNTMIFSRVGNVVTCSGLVTADATATGIVTFRMSLPIVSDIQNTTDVAGTFNNPSSTGITGVVTGDITNDSASFTGNSATTGAASLRYTFQYIVR